MADDQTGVSVSALTAFLTTWSAARATFGEGTPQTGEQFDHSATFHSLQAQAESAAPGSVWSGTAADAYAAVNAELVGVLGGLAGLDARLRSQVDSAAEVVSAGRRELEEVREAVLTVARRIPPGQFSEQIMWPIVAHGVGEVSRIVRRSNGLLNEIGAKLNELAEEYRKLSEQKFGGGLPEQPAGEAPDEELENEDPAEAERDRRLEEILRDYQVGEDPRGTHEIDFPAWADRIAGREIPTQELTAKEIAMLLSNPHKIKPLLDIQQHSTEKALEMFPPPDGREIDNQTDAFRHAYANALMTQEFGAEWTAEFTTAHEGRENNFASSEAMDLYNNEIGRQIALANPNASREELAALVAQAVHNGETVVIRPDGQGLEWSDRIAPADTGNSASSAPVDGPPQQPYP
ncbi:DUF6973 domain-containing protein [Mycolicibacterium thermoresistibile]